MSETLRARKGSTRLYRDADVAGPQVEHGERCLANSKEFQRGQTTSTWTKLWCVLSRWSGLQRSNPIPSLSQSMFSNDISAPKNCDCSAPGVSVSLKSSNPSEDISVRPLFMRRLRSSSNRSITDDTVGVRGGRCRNDLKKWYMAQNEEPHDYDGVMHAVFFDTHDSKE